MSNPRQTCKLCGMSVVVQMDGRGFPPKIAENMQGRWLSV